MTESSRGQAYPISGSRGSLSVAPARGGKQIANLWRVWVQGDEIYLATRNSTKNLKVSLHVGGKWVVRYATDGRWNLGPPLPLSLPGWTHAIELSFLVGDDTLPPQNFIKIKRSTAALLVNTPIGCKLLVDVLLTLPGIPATESLPSEMHGTRLMNMTLRDGRGMVVTSRVDRMTPAEVSKIAEMRGAAQGLRLKMDRPPKAGEDVVETFSVHSNNSGGGNVIRIFPLGKECFV